MTHSRLNWFLVPVAFTMSYAVMTWAVWVPLDRSMIAAKYGILFIPYWQGQVLGFATVRILGAMFVCGYFFFFRPSGGAWRTFLTGAAFGIVTSIVDRFCWEWLKHFAFLLALLAIPIASGACVLLLFGWIEARWPDKEAIRDTLA